MVYSPATIVLTRRALVRTREGEVSFCLVLGFFGLNPALLLLRSLR